MADYFDRAFNMVIEPFLAKLSSNKRITDWFLWDMKRLTVSFYNIMDGLIKKLQTVYIELKSREDPVFLQLDDRADEITMNICLIACLWSYGGILNSELRKVFEDTFTPFKRLFHLNVGSQSRVSNAKLSLFDIYFDFEKLEFELMSEKLEYKLKMHYDAEARNLMIPT